MIWQIKIGEIDMEEVLYSVYRHISPSGKVYVGITCQPVEHRWNHGRGYMNLKKTIFKSTIIKYGWDNIKHEVLFTELPEWRAKRLEVSLIRHYKNLGISLNVTDGGDGCHGVTPWNKGIKVPYEKSNKLKGGHLTEEHKKKLSDAHKGKHLKGHKWTEEQRQKLMLQFVGRHHTEAVRKKISQNSAKSRRIIELDSEGCVIMRFNSAAEASRYYHIDGGWVSRACNNRLLCKGHIFIHEDDLVDISEVKYGRYKAGNSITVRNKETEEIKEFHSESSCARFLGVGKSALRKAAKNGYCVKNVWEIIDSNGKEVKQSTYNANKPKRVVCVNIITDERRILPSILECKRFLELNSDCSIKKALNGIRSSNIIKGWEVSYAA